MAITIEGARESDLPDLLALLRRSGLPEAGLGDHLATVLVAREGGRIVGSAAVELYGPSALLRSVAVEEGLRGRGLGQRLTHGALDLARRRGARTIYLLTETADRFFARLGFQPISRQQVSPDVQRSVEFTSACPATAHAMKLDLTSETTAAPSGGT